MSGVNRSILWPAFRAAIDSDAAKDRGNNDVTTWSQACLHFILLTQARLQGVAEDTYHDCWYRFIATSQNLDADHPAQDRLVMQIMFAKILGTLAQNSAPATKNTLIEHSDPPFLVEDLVAVCQHGFSAMDVEQRTNFLGFVARLVAVGVGVDCLGTFVTTYVRDTLKHHGLEDLIAADRDSHPLDPAHAEILKQKLHVMRVLLQYCGHRIVMAAEGAEEVKRWTALLYAIEASFATEDERRTSQEQARLASNWLGTFGQMIGIDRVPRSSV